MNHLLYNMNVWKLLQMLNIIKILTPLYKNELQSRGYSPPPILTEQMLNSETEKRQEKKPIPLFLNCV